MPINRAFQRLKKPMKDGFLLDTICGGGICRHTGRDFVVVVFINESGIGK
nr:MAG TPA: hypothetical protein [Caudoviricetes sp.]